MMNLFRFAGDMCHILSILVLLLRLRVTKNAIGISVKTQELYLLVFVTRYLDLFTSYYSLYNSVMKVVYIASTALIIYTVKMTEPFKSNYDSAQDSFLHWKFAVAPVAVIALITNIYQGFDFIEVSSSHVAPSDVTLLHILTTIFLPFRSYFGCSPSISRPSPSCRS
jgi:ER lumen protein retaining receptor